MDKLHIITTGEDIPHHYRETPIGRLIEYHNLEREFDPHMNAELLIGMCMDNRKTLTVPDNFAFIIRAGGANLRHSEFKVSYAISVGKIRYIALIGHTQCAMVDLAARKDQFVEGLVEGAGWETQAAEEHFAEFAPIFEIGNEVEFIVSEVQRLRLRYPKIMVVPFLYRVEDGRLYLIKEDQ